MAINVNNLRVYNMTVGAGSGGGNGGGGGGGSTPSYLFVAAPKDSDQATYSGTVYAYSTSNYSAAPTKLQAPTATASLHFGKQMAVTGTTLFVGAEGHAGNGYNAGAVYVYDTTNLSATPTLLTANDGSAYDYFGKSIAASSNYTVIGGDAAFYVYDTTNLSGTPTKITKSGVEFGERNQLAIVGNYVVASQGHYNGSYGRAWVYDLTNLSAAPFEIPNQITSAPRRFGYVVGASGTNFIIGGNDANTAYVFDSTNLSTSPTTTLTPYDGASNNFGSHLNSSADYIVIGAEEDSGTNGAAYVYDASNLSTQATKLTPSDGQSNGRFGRDISINGTNLCIAAPFSNSTQGKVYVYDASDLSIAPTVITASDGAANDEFGAETVFG